MQLNRAQFNKWLRALRSGKYSQTQERLEDQYGYCCLGVACKILIPKKKQEIGWYYFFGETPSDQKHAPNWLKNIDYDFAVKTGVALTDLNDNYGYTFEQIADVLDKVYNKKQSLVFDLNTRSFKRKE